MPRQSGFMSTMAVSSLSSTNQKPAKPVRKCGNRRENYGSTDKRPDSASNYGLRQEAVASEPGSSRSSSAETPADILKQYEEGLKAPRPDYWKLILYLNKKCFSSFKLKSFIITNTL